MRRKAISVNLWKLVDWVGLHKGKELGLLGKWLWRFSSEQGSVWQSIIRSKYGSTSNRWECSQHISSSTSMLYRSIIRLSPVFLPFIRFVVGNGKSLKFWKDHWWGDQCLSSSFPRLFHLSNKKEATISEIFSPSFSGHTWNLTFSRDLYEWEVDLLAPLVSNLEEAFISQIEKDKRIWILGPQGSFHVNLSSKL